MKIIKIELKNLTEDFDQADKDYIGNQDTLIAFKNPTSYMIGSSKKGYKLVEDNKVLCWQKWPYRDGSPKTLFQILYVKHLDCYFFFMHQKLFQKLIDDEQAVIFMDLKYLGTSSLPYYSELNKRLILDTGKISVVDLDTKKIEFERKSQMVCFKVFGEKEDRLMTIDPKGSVILFKLHYKKKAMALVELYKIKLNRKEIPKVIEVCPKNQYAFLEIRDGNEKLSKTSRIFILGLAKDMITLKAELDVLKQRTSCKSALKCVRYYGKRILWLGLGATGAVMLFVYDTVSGELKELENRRQNSGELHAKSLQKISRNELYFTGYYGKVMSITLAKERIKYVPGKNYAK